MPIERVTLPNGEHGYRYGKSGKIYKGKDALKKAQAQAAAIHAAGFKEPTKGK